MQKESNKTLVVFLIILGFLAGVFGGVGGIALVSNSQSLQKSLGIENSNLTPLQNREENIKITEDSAIIDTVKKVSPSVVSVVYTKDVQVINPFDFFGSEGSTVQQQQGGGSGFIISSDGLIATNKHVAQISGAKYTVITSDGKKYDANVVATHPTNDFAILKIDAKNLPVVEFGNSDDLQIGQRIVAIGNALGEFQNTVTTGILSGKERNLEATDASGSQSETLEGLLQTDAAINSGNSGGPLVNTRGQIIGINTATAEKSVAEGLGFAIPINPIKSAIDSYKKTGKIIVAYLGVSYVMVDQKVAASQNLKTDHGALIIGDTQNGIPAVQSGSPADKAGLKQGDVILKINSDEINEGISLSSLLGKYQPNDEVNLKVLRDGNEIDLKAKLGEMPS